ncbi:hypothetical protein F4811DRAFT_554626 [Daldinia bambusicola]|nr:hypothetical protein F4811DRAFT_554626 [Daldinia bambusicola]
MPVTLTNIQAQFQSPFFSRLPGKIRNAIYEYCCVNATEVYICRGPIRLRPAPPKLTSLHKACKRMYNEVYDMLFASHLELVTTLDANGRQGDVLMVSDGVLDPSRLRSVGITYRYGRGLAYILGFCSAWLSREAPNIRAIGIGVNQHHSNSSDDRMYILALFDMIIPDFLAFKHLEHIELEMPLNIDLAHLVHRKLVGRAMTEQVKLYKAMTRQLPGGAATYRIFPFEASDREIPDEKNIELTMPDYHSKLEQLIRYGRGRLFSAMDNGL